MGCCCVVVNFSFSFSLFTIWWQWYNNLVPVLAWAAYILLSCLLSFNYWWSVTASSCVCWFHFKFTLTHSLPASMKVICLFVCLFVLGFSTSSHILHSKFKLQTKHFHSENWIFNWVFFIYIFIYLSLFSPDPAVLGAVFFSGIPSGVGHLGK